MFRMIWHFECDNPPKSTIQTHHPRISFQCGKNPPKHFSWFPPDNLQLPETPQRVSESSPPGFALQGIQRLRTSGVRAFLLANPM